MKREKTIPNVASFAIAPVLKSGGQPITAAKRDELLRAVAAGEYVELELEISPAYEQKPGEQNRNFVRFRDGAMLALGRSGKNTPFLRDHEQGDARARGGTITDSRTEKRGEGDYAIHQTVKLTALWAVDMALRGLLSTVSIGWNSTGGMECSVCGADYFSCSHFRGERYSMREMEDGSQRPVQDDNGSIVAEVVYTDAELVETSAVSVPAVPSAHIEDVRAARLGRNSGFSAERAHGDNVMNPNLLAMLGLAATAGDPEVLKAVESLVSAKKLVEQQRNELANELAAVSAKLAGYEQVLAKAAEDKFISDAIAAGKIVPGSPFEKRLRIYYGTDRDGAAALVADSPVVTPVGLPRQTNPEPANDPARNPIDAAILAAGGNPTTIRAQLARDGMTPERIEKQLANMVSGKVA